MRISAIKRAIRSSITLTFQQSILFFKTKEGQYAQHDEFIGVTLPNLRKIAKNFNNISFDEIKILLSSRFNEERMLALVILVDQYAKAENGVKEYIYMFYIDNIKSVNNWNLVDSSAHFVIGAHLWDKERDFLVKLAKSENMWERRISIVATWYFIRKKDLDWTFKIAKLLLKDKHDLVHKATGWMLREAGKRNKKKLIAFLDLHALKMPRTMLRYAIERFDQNTRKYYLQKALQ